MTEQDTLGDSTPEKRRIHDYFSESWQSTWLSWVLATTLGATGGGIAFEVLRQRDFSFAWIAGLGILGLVIGLAQASVLKRVFYRPGSLVRISLQWILTCLISWVVGGVAGFVVPVAIWLFLAFAMNVDYTWMRRSGYYVHWVSFVSLGAFVVSIAQQCILRARINPTGQWIWASTISWCAGWAVGSGIAHIMPGNGWIKGAIGGAAGGVIVGTITGHALVRLLAGSPRGEEDSA